MSAPGRPNLAKLIISTQEPVQHGYLLVGIAVHPDDQVVAKAHEGQPIEVQIIGENQHIRATVLVVDGIYAGSRAV